MKELTRKEKALLISAMRVKREVLRNKVFSPADDYGIEDWLGYNMAFDRIKQKLTK